MSKKMIILILLLFFSSFCYAQHSPIFEKTEKNWLVMEPNITYSMDLNNSVFTSITFSINKNLNFTKITFQDMPDMPEQAKRVSNLYEQGFIVVMKNIEEEDIIDVYFDYKVEKQWLIDNNLNKSTLRLVRNSYSWNNNTYRFADWQNLTTKITGEDNQYYYLESVSPGFSYFAITADNNSVSNSSLNSQNELVANLSDYQNEKTNIELVYNNTINLSGDIKTEKDNSNAVLIFSLVVLAIFMIFAILAVTSYLSKYNVNQNYEKSYIHAVEDYIKTGIKNNMSYAEINQRLVDAGWEKEIVDFVLYELRRDGGKILQVLYGYVKSQKALAKSNAEIMQNLIVSGWPEKVANAVLMEYKGR